MKKINIILTLLLIIFIVTTVIYIKKEAQKSHKPIVYPFYVSTRYNTTNLRTGPSTNYPKTLTYHIKSYPFKVINKHELWYNIKDVNGRTGWVSIPLTTSKQTAIVTQSKTNMYIANNLNSKIIAILDKDNIVYTKECNSSTLLCKVELQVKKDLKFIGWISRANLWGGKVQSLSTN